MQMNTTGMGKSKKNAQAHDAHSSKPVGRNKRNPGTLSMEPEKYNERDSPAINTVRKPPTNTNKYLAAIGQEELHEDPDKPTVKKRNKRT